MRHIYLILFCGFFNLLSSPLKAQVRFTATITPGKIGTQDYATLRYTISGSMDINHIYPPDFNSVELVSGPNNELDEMNFKGRTVGVFSLSFVVKPLKPGKITFPGARARIAGKDYVSNPLSLQVLKVPSIVGTHLAPGMSSPEDTESILKPGENVSEKVRRNMVLKLETNKKEVFVGEPVLASFKLYSRLKSNSRLTLNPSFNGFSVIDLQAPDETEAGTGKLNGQEFNVYTVRKALLYPLQAGNYQIDKLELENQVQFNQPGPRPDPYDLFSILDHGNNTVIKIVNLETDPVEIKVRPLPEKNRPPDFSGAVGTYRINTRLMRDSFAANEEGRLIVEISGSGNLQLVNAPTVQWPQGVEAFEPQVKDTMNAASFPVYGRKTFEFAFSANKAGSYTIPAVNFSYFDPEQGRYVSGKSEQLSFHVSKAKSLSTVDMPPVSRQHKNKTSFWLWLILPAAIISAAALFVVFRGLRRERENEKKPVIAPEPVNEADFPSTASPLNGASNLCYEGNSRDFYPVLNRELKEWLNKKFCLQANEVSMDRLRQCMDEKDIPNKTVLETQALLREIEWQLYAPSDDRQKMHEHFARASMLVQDLNAAIRVG